MICLFKGYKWYVYLKVINGFQRMKQSYLINDFLTLVFNFWNKGEFTFFWVRDFET